MGNKGFERYRKVKDMLLDRVPADFKGDLEQLESLLISILDSSPEIQEYLENTVTVYAAKTTGRDEMAQTWLNENSGNLLNDIFAKLQSASA